MSKDEGNAANVFRILVATDSHVGHKESDAVRSEDSFRTLEEVLYIAKTLNVDFLLHGGDLFDIQKPTNSTMYRVLGLLRQYCLGQKREAKSVEFLSDSELVCNGDDEIRTAKGELKFGFNCETEHINVELPIFMIHGNHDDPGGEANLSALDILEVSHLINYFGRNENQDDVKVCPLILRKGTTKLALYGLGNVRDERLHRAFQANKVKFLLPKEKTEEIFNCMVLHQNRYKGSAGGAPTKSCIHEAMLPSFLDLVIWGHEHDSLMEPQESIKGEFHILQPGSGIQTSMSMGEALPKHVALLEILGDSFRSTAIPLVSVRTLLHYDICLAERSLMSTDEKEIAELLISETQKLIQEAEQTRQNRLSSYEVNFPILSANIEPLVSKQLPLIRLRVEHTGFPTISSSRFGQQFINCVANPQDILQFHRKAASRRISSGGQQPDIAIHSNEGVDAHDLIFHYVEDSAASLSLIPEPDMNLAVQNFVVKSDPNAISSFVAKTIRDVQGDLNGLSNLDEAVNFVKTRTEKLRGERFDQSRAVEHMETEELVEEDISAADIKRRKLENSSVSIMRDQSASFTTFQNSQRTRTRIPFSSTVTQEDLLNSVDSDG